MAQGLPGHLELKQGANVDAITISDRGTLVGLQDNNTQAFLTDSLGWLRDLAAKYARNGATSIDGWSQELDKLNTPLGGLSEYLKQKDNWIADLFAAVLGVIEQINPLTVGKQIAIWILEDFRDVLRALATLIDTKDDTADETQDALVEIALAAAALGVPYVGRAGKVLMRMFKGTASLEHGVAMLRHIDAGNVVKYLQKLNLSSHAGKIMDVIKRIMGKVGEFIGKYAPKIKSTLDAFVAKVSGWITRVLAKIQLWINAAIAKLQKLLYDGASNLANNKWIDKMPDQLLDWVSAQINGNLCESCVDNYLVNFMEYERLYPKPDSNQRDKSSFFGPDKGIDGLFEKPATAVASPGFPADYSGIPLSLGHVLDELNIEIEGFKVPKAIDRAIKPFGNIPADFNPTAKKPPKYPRFVVMEAKFGYHAKAGKKLNDKEWEGKLGVTTSGGRQMSKTWIEARLRDVLPPGPDGTPNAKRDEIRRALYSRWLYGCQPHKASNSKQARARGGKRTIGLAFFPPYALRGYDIDAMRWSV
jgi:hypothetical protein